MKNRTWGTGIATAALSVTLSACGGNATQVNPSFTPSTNPTDLTGTWSSTSRSYLGADGNKGAGTETLTIGPIQNNVFEATRNITLQTPADFGDGKGQVTTATFKTVGVVSPDGTFTIVKRGDDGQLKGWLVNSNTIDAVYTESGPEPYVARETLVRK